MTTTIDEESSSPVRSNSEIWEMITAAETLMLLSRARASNSSAKTTIRNTNKSRTPNMKKKNKKKIVSTKNVTFRLHRRVLAAKNHDFDVPEPSSWKRKKHNADDALRFKSPAACSCHVSDDLDEFKLPPKKTKLNHTTNDDSSTNKEKTVIKKPPADKGPTPPPDMPENVKSLILEMGGTGVVLVTQKRLTATDVERHNNRLQMPLSQICNTNFLTDQEKHYLTRKDGKQWNSIETPLLDPALEKHKILLRRWLMAKSSSAAKSTENYVLNKPWNDIVKDNTLKEGDAIQLWGFRVAEQLNLALLKL